MKGQGEGGGLEGADRLNRGGRRREVVANMWLQAERTNGADTRDKAGDLKGLV